MNEFIFFFILGIVQGILEWLPVSSSGNVTLILVNYAHTSFSEAVRVSLFLHAGTLLSVVAKYRSQLYELAKDAFSVKRSPLLDFYVAATLVSAVVGIPVFLLLSLEIPERIGSFLIALFLIVTGLMIGYQKRGLKSIGGLKILDAIIVGAAQGVSVIPGVSRSGMTVSTLLWRGMNQEEALHLSFLLSVPPVIGLTILTFSGFSWVYVVSLAVSFVCSFLMMDVLMRTARRFSFSIFCFIVAGITLFFVFFIG